MKKNIMKSFNYYLNEFNEVGIVEFVSRDVVGMSGLPSVKPGELVVFESGQIGQTLLLNHDSVEILFFDETPVKSGTRVARTNETLSIPVGKELLGKLINPLGQSMNSSRSISKVLEKRPIKIEPPGIEVRTPITKHLETGVSLVDLLVPVGEGQRELIIGDRKTGKTSFLLQTVLNQARKGTICIWAVIGKKTREIKQIVEFFEEQKVMENIIVVASRAEDPPGLVYITPLSAITLAEYFKELGQNTLVILDDLTIHAKYYREFSLLSRRFPGREAYPVDIFFTHAAIMERGGNFINKGKEDVSITILPSCETNEGDLSGYIQTNLMSMTDGHIYFDKDMFSQGKRPSIDPFLSVTRVGKQTQTPLARDLSRELIAFLVNHQKLNSFVHFGTELTDEVKKVLDKGDNILVFFNQKAMETVPVNVTIFIIGCIWSDLWQEKNKGEVKTLCDEMITKYKKETKFKNEIDEIVSGAKNLKELEEKVKQLNFL